MATPRRLHDIEGDIEALVDLPRSDLIGRWQTLVGELVPKGASRRLLILAVAYELQVRHYGGLTARTRRQLKKMVEPRGGSQAPKNAGYRAAGPGSRLVREWNGRNHVVDVVDGGYVWKGDRYRSLSAVARAITGARWSGPRFFGLDKGDAA
jgi:hypothetical protein